MFLYTCLIFFILIAEFETSAFQLNKKEIECFDNKKKVDANYLKGYNESKKNYNFPEFDKIGHFLQLLVKDIKNKKCKSQLRTYVESLKNSSLWAVQMFDASAKIPQGLLTSDAYDLGNYDECIDINLQRSQNDNIFGKYCLVTLKITKQKNSQQNYQNKVPSVFESQELILWEKFMGPILQYGFINDVYRHAICLPNLCTNKDLKIIFKNLFARISEIYQLKIGISISDNSCSTKQIKESKLGSLFSRIIIGMVICVTVSTVFDLLRLDNNFFLDPLKISEHLSAYRNFKYLTANATHIPTLGSLKVYVLVLLVVIRRLSFLIEGPVINRRATDQVLSPSFKEHFFYISSNLEADALLLLQGFSSLYKTYWAFKKNSKLTILRVYLAELFQALPLYIFIITFYGNAFETVGSGPLWKERTSNSIRNCKENWLANVLYVNNFLQVNKMCIYESWYFAVAAQCFTFVPIIVQLMRQCTMKALLFLGLLTALFIMLPKSINFLNNSASYSRNRESLLWHQKINIGTSDKILPYFFGMFLAIIYIEIKKKKSLFPTLQNKIIFFSATTVCFLIQYKVSSQFFCYLSSFWIIIGALTKSLPAINFLFNNSYLSLLGHLMYPFILILELVQLYMTGTMRTLEYFSFSRLIWMSASDLLTTFIFAFIFHMIFQKPITILMNKRILKLFSVAGSFLLLKIYNI